MHRTIPTALLLAAILLTVTARAQGAELASPIARALLQVLTSDPASAATALETVDRHFDRRAVPMIMDTIYLSRVPQVGLGLFRVLQRHTGQSLGFDLSAWWQWMWSQDTPMHPD